MEFLKTTKKITQFCIVNRTILTLMHSALILQKYSVYNNDESLKCMRDMKIW